jgi:hypothetical protein
MALDELAGEVAWDIPSAGRIARTVLDAIEQAGFAIVPASQLAPAAPA